MRITYPEIAMGAIGLFIAYRLLNRALSLLNEASDVAVFFGYLTIVALACAGIATARWIWKRTE